MFSFSGRSLQQLDSCHPQIRLVMKEVIKEVDITISCGYRSKYDQDAAFLSGNSLLRFPMSKHNQVPSLAVDVLPFPTLWSDVQAFHDLAPIIKRVAASLGVNLIWGGDWKKFVDLPHWELILRKGDQ